MNQKVKIFLLYCSNKCILRRKESKCLESRRDCGWSLCRKTSMQRKPGNHSSAKTHAFAAAKAAKKLAYFRKDQMVKNPSAMQGIGFNPWVRKISWRSEWQPTAVFLPKEFHRQRCMVGYSPWHQKESAMPERPHFPFQNFWDTWQ